MIVSVRWNMWAAFLTNTRFIARKMIIQGKVRV